MAAGFLEMLVQKSKFQGNTGEPGKLTLGSAIATQHEGNGVEMLEGRKDVQAGRVRIQDCVFKENEARGEPVSIRSVVDVGLYNITVSSEFT